MLIQHNVYIFYFRQLIVNVFKMSITKTSQILVKSQVNVKNHGVTSQHLRYLTCGELFIGLHNF